MSKPTEQDFKEIARLFLSDCRYDTVEVITPRLAELLHTQYNLGFGNGADEMRERYGKPRRDRDDIRRELLRDLGLEHLIFNYNTDIPATHRERMNRCENYEYKVVAR